MVEQVLITSGAMTFLVLAATLVTATFLFSPTIEQIFGNVQQRRHFLILEIIGLKSYFCPAEADLHRQVLMLYDMC